MIFRKGDKVKHTAREEWGIGQIVKVDSSGSVVVKFKNYQEVSIVRGNKVLIKVDESGNAIKKPEKFKEGERVKSKKYPDWGLGEVLTDSYGRQTKIFFEHQGIRHPDSIEDKLVKVTGKRVFSAGLP